MFLATILRRYPLFVATLAMSAVYLLMDMYLHFDTFDWVIDTLTAFEYLKAHEIILLSGWLILGVAADQYRNVVRLRRERNLDRDRIRVVRSTMTAVQDIVNNALNNLVFIHIEAEKSQALSPETLRRFEDLISDTAQKLKNIHDLEAVSERVLGADISSLQLDSEPS